MVLVEIKPMLMATKMKFHRKQYVQANRREKLVVFAVVIVVSLWAMIIA